jgi:hypothetical protein
MDGLQLLHDLDPGSLLSPRGKTCVSCSESSLICCVIFHLLAFYTPDLVFLNTIVFAMFGLSKSGAIV